MVGIRNCDLNWRQLSLGDLDSVGSSFDALDTGWLMVDFHGDCNGLIMVNHG